MAKVDNKKIDQYVGKLERQSGCRSVHVGITAVASTGKVWRVRKQAYDDVSRTAAQNIIAMRDNAKKGRDIVFFKPQEAREIRGVFKKSVKEFQSSGSENPLIKGGEVAGDMFIKNVTSHIKNSESKTGKTAPVTDRTRKRKVREAGPGKPEPPPMERTGQLQRALTKKVKLK